MDNPVPTKRKFLGFPNHPTLEEMRAVITTHPEIRECPFDGYIVFSYFWCKDTTFADPKLSDHENSLLKECRGLVFSPEGKILSRRYHKFFNINEKDETRLEVIDFNRSYVILEKLDGSMVAPFLLNDKVNFGTRLGSSVVATEAEKFIQSQPSVRYLDFCRDYLLQDYSPIFEYCSKETPIILKYETDQLVVTALRHNITGEYMLYPLMVEACKAYNVPCIKTISIPSTNINDIIHTIRTNQELEGCVLRFSDGDMFKIKTDWYHGLGAAIHKFTKSKHNNEKYYWKQILENTYDDLRPYLGDKREYLDRFANDLLGNIERIAKQITEKALELKEGTTNRGQFSQRVKDNVKDTEFQVVYFHVYEGKDARESLVHTILKKIENAFETATKLAGGIRYVDYKPTK